jgi:alkane 1-monooxygenase
MKALRYALPFLFLATVPVGFALGGVWAFLTVAALPLAICGFDGVLGFDSDAEARDDGLSYRLLVWLYIPLQIAVTAWGAMEAARSGVALVEVIGLTISTGLTAGIFGMLAAHEMVHSTAPRERALGLIQLASTGYMHFRIAHIYGHHVRGATPEDPASARRGESVYIFVVRSVTGQAREAWRFEAARLRRRNRPVFSPGNRMLVYGAAQGLIAVSVGLFSLRSLAFWISQAILAVFMLELFNYIAHYGLQRRLRPSGGYERIEARHSWNSTRRMNNWSLFNMGRHSDHHRSPTRAYQALRPEADEPELPTGYGGAILMALIPPLWRVVMDPRVDAWSSAVRTRPEPAS